MKMIPVEYKVLVQLDPVEEKTSGGLIIASSTVEKEQMAQVKATLLAVGGNAFTDWQGRIPEPGDRVLISKYSGFRPVADKNDDGLRICNDKDICAILEE